MCKKKNVFIVSGIFTSTNPCDWSNVSTNHVSYGRKKIKWEIFFQNILDAQILYTSLVFSTVKEKLLLKQEQEWQQQRERLRERHTSDPCDWSVFIVTPRRPGLKTDEVMKPLGRYSFSTGNLIVTSTRGQPCLHLDARAARGRRQVQPSAAKCSQVQLG